jgi:hypothetical protein
MYFQIVPVVIPHNVLSVILSFSLIQQEDVNNVLKDVMYVMQHIVRHVVMISLLTEPDVQHALTVQVVLLKLLIALISLILLVEIVLATALSALMQHPVKFVWKASS